MWSLILSYPFFLRHTVWSSCELINRQDFQTIEDDMYYTKIEALYEDPSYQNFKGKNIFLEASIIKYTYFYFMIWSHLSYSNVTHAS